MIRYIKSGVFGVCCAFVISVFFTNVAYSAGMCTEYPATHTYQYGISTVNGSMTCKSTSTSDTQIGRVIYTGTNPSNGLYIAIWDCINCPSGKSPTNIVVQDNVDIDCYYNQVACCSSNMNSSCGTTGWQQAGSSAHYDIYYSSKGTYDCLGVCQMPSPTQYRCHAGYYGKNGNCTKCPNPTDFYKDATGTVQPAAISATGAETLDDCYVNAGTYHDDAGVFSFATTCPYTGSGYSYTLTSSTQGTISNGSTSYTYYAYCKTSSSMTSYQPFPQTGGTWCWCLGNNNYTLYGNASSATDCTNNCVTYCGERLSSSGTARASLGW